MSSSRLGLPLVGGAFSWPHVLRVVLLLAVLIARLVGQRFIVVDPLNGPGTNYTDMVTALAAANHKDRILYRNPTSFPPDWTIAKGVTIMAEVNGGIPLPRLVTIKNIPATEAVTLVRFYGNAVFPPPLINDLTIDNCGGIVNIEESYFTKITVTGCSLVSMQGCSWSVLAPVRSHVVLAKCVARPMIAPYGPVIQAKQARLELADCQFDGDGGELTVTCYLVRLPGSAASLDGCTLSFHGDHNIFRGGWMYNVMWCGVNIQADAIVAQNNCILSVAPGMILRGAVTGSYTLTSDPRSSLTASYPPVTDWIEIEVGAKPFDSVGLFMSNPTLPYTSSLGELYLDPAASWWVTNATCDGSGRLIKDYVVPASIPRGLTLSFQAATVSPTYGFKLTNPSMVCLTRRSDH